MAFHEEEAQMFYLHHKFQSNDHLAFHEIPIIKNQLLSNLK